MTDQRTPAERRRDAMALQAIEANPLDADDTALFEMFDREGWSNEQRRAYLIDQARRSTPPVAAE